LCSLVLSGARAPWDWQGENYSLGKTSDFGKFCFKFSDFYCDDA